MNPLKVAHKAEQQPTPDAEFKQFSDDLLKEQRKNDILKAEKKYKVSLDHLRRKYNIK